MISLLGDWAGRLALTVLVLERTGSPAWAAAVTAVSLAGFVGIGQVLATLADRHGRVDGDARRRRRARRAVPRRCSSTSRWARCSCWPSSPASPRRRSRRPGRAALPDLVPEDDYGDALGAVGHLGAVRRSCSATRSAGCCSPSSSPRRRSPSTPAASSCRRCSCSSCAAAPAARPAAAPSTVERLAAATAPPPCSATGWSAGRWSSSPSPAPSAPSTRRSSCPTPSASGCPAGYLGAAGGRGPGRHAARPRWSIAGGTRDHHSLLRNGGVVRRRHRRRLAAPLFWFEASGAAGLPRLRHRRGGMFAVSIPTNTVIGLRLSRDTRASAMGIAVGVLMGSQALGAAVGGLVASVVGLAPRHRRRARGRGRVQPVVAWSPRPPTPSTSPCAAGPPPAPDAGAARRRGRSCSTSCAVEAEHRRRPRGHGRSGAAGGRAPVNHRAGGCVSPVMRLTTRPAVAPLVAAGEPRSCSARSRRLRLRRRRRRRRGDDTTTTAPATTRRRLPAADGGERGRARSWPRTSRSPTSRWRLARRSCSRTRASATHTATADDGSFDPGEVGGRRDVGPVTAPTSPGDYAFHCEIHPT